MRLLLLIAVIGLLCSCEDHGKIRVQNKVHNVRLDRISWGDFSIAYSLLTGEESDEVTITDKKGSFPKIYNVSFYMENNGKTVYLKTKSKFQLDADQNLLIVISDTTQVVNPAL